MNKSIVSRECPQPSDSVSEARRSPALLRSADRILEILYEKYGEENVGRTILDIPEMGYPLAWVVVINDQYRPWWEVM